MRHPSRRTAAQKTQPLNPSLSVICGKGLFYFEKYNMNYALDALWWRLRRPAVRQLAALLTAPPLWHSGCELPVRELLGDKGFRLLLDWDDKGINGLPEAHPDERLGQYAERLLVFWLSHAPHSRLLAHNLPVYDPNGQTAGALDFIAQLNGVTYHIELCCKYFGATDGTPEKMAGFNPADTLSHKSAKLLKQLDLSHSTAAVQALAAAGIAPDSLRRVSLVRGMGFSADGSLPETAPYTANAWTGRLLTRLPEVAEGCRWYALKRQEYLAPVRVQTADLLLPDADTPNGLYAETALRDDGYWHETARVMLRDGTLPA